MQKKQATKVFCNEKNAEMHDNARKQKPHPNKQGMATNFIIKEALNVGRCPLPSGEVWSEASGA